MRPSGSSGPPTSMPYGPSRPASQQPAQTRTPAILPIASPPTSPRSMAFGGDSDGETIPMAAISSRPQSSDHSYPAASGTLDGSDYSSTARDVPAPRSDLTKPSREPLLPQHNIGTDSMRSAATEESGRGGLAGVFTRHSVDSLRMSSDLEHGMREVATETPHNYISPGPGPTHPNPISNSNGANATRSSSLDRSDDRAMTYRTVPDSTADLHQSKVSQITRDEPKTKIHPHPVLIPAAPIINEKTGKPLRNHNLIPSRNHFFLRGKALTGGDSPLPFIATVTVIFGIAAVWFSCTAPWWWHNVSIAVPIVAAYMTLFCLASLLMTVCLSTLGPLSCCGSCD